MTSPSVKQGWKASRRSWHFKLPFKWPSKWPKPPKSFWKNAVLACVALFILGTLGILGLFAYVSRDLPDPSTLTTRNIPQSTKIYDRTGEHLLYEIHGDENRTLVKLQEGLCEKGDAKLETDPNGIPLRMLQATIAAEDHAFCTHYGFTIKGIGRAALFGGSRGGGSTLTQQLVKNAILTNERSIIRKIRELILSIELERRYSKDEILQIYFNEIGYGSTYYGVETASQNYFHKHVSDLTLAQMATLAALPQRPSTFLNDPELLKGRRDWILDEMVDLAFITREEADVAKTEDTSIAVNVTNIAAPHFVFYVKDLLEEKYGQRAIEEGGYKVITTLDFDKQIIAEEEVRAGVEGRGEQYGFTNASLVALDPKTSQVLAMVGSKDYFDDEIDGQVNVSLRPRQPGSSFKPIVYTKAFAMGYTPNTILWDVKTNFGTASGTYSPNNYDLGERGPIRAREALQGSLNIPAVQILYMVGVDNALNFATELGYTTFEDRANFGLAIVLGGAEVKLLEHANAYAALANDGVSRPPVAILRVEDPKGNVIEEWKESEGKKVLEPNVARMITNVLSDNGARAYVFGTGSYLQLGNRPAAAKTGTTNDYHDAWTMGYVPSLVAGVWVGNNDNSAMSRGADGSIIAAPIWNAFMKRALDTTPVEYFTAPAIPTTGKDIIDGKIPSTTVTVDKVSGKLATEYTPSELREERTYAEYHSLLHYIDRANPLGPPPSDPKNDPYYEPWEKAIQDWIAKREAETGIKITQQAVPTEYDDVHTPENTPTVRIMDPNDGAELVGRDVSIDVDAFAARGITRVEYYVDGFFLGSSSSAPYRLNAILPDTITRGYHTVKAVAYDDVQNTGSDTIGIRVESDGVEIGFELVDPKNGQTIERMGSTYTVVYSLQNPTDYSSVTAYYQPIGSGSQSVLGVAIDPTAPFLTFTWTLPEDGDYALSASAMPKSEGGRVETAAVVVHVTTADSSETPAEEAPADPADTGETTPEPTSLPPLDPFAQPVTP